MYRRLDTLPARVSLRCLSMPLKVSIVRLCHFRLFRAIRYRFVTSMSTVIFIVMHSNGQHRAGPNIQFNSATAMAYRLEYSSLIPDLYINMRCLGNTDPANSRGLILAGRLKDRRNFRKYDHLIPHSKKICLQVVIFLGQCAYVLKVGTIKVPFAQRIQFCLFLLV